MVWQQTISVQMRDRQNMVEKQLEEISIIVFFNEDIFPVDAAIVDVVIASKLERSGLLHD